MTTQWEHVAFVKSLTDARKRYEIKRRAADGLLGCSCPSWKFSKMVKTCKHIAQMSAAVFTSLTPETETARIVVAEEAFEVVRRIKLR